MLLHRGVSLFLLDHLLITAILLVCDPQEWTVTQSGSSSTISIGDMQSTASLQSAHREPLYSDSRPPQSRPELKSVLSFSSNSDDGDVTCSGSPGNASHVADPSWRMERNALPSQNDKRLTFISEPSHTTDTSAGPSSLRKRRPSEPALRLAHSTRRPLPQTPAVLGGDSRVIRRVQSHIRSEPGRLYRPPLPLPPIPTSAFSGIGRSLPPTPCELSPEGSIGRQSAPTASGVPPPKSFDHGEDNPRWIQLLGGGGESVLPRTSFEQLPPAYSSLDFGPPHLDRT